MGLVAARANYTIIQNLIVFNFWTKISQRLVRIELTSADWKSEVLPLNYNRIKKGGLKKAIFFKGGLKLEELGPRTFRPWVNFSSAKANQIDSYNIPAYTQGKKYQ